MFVRFEYTLNSTLSVRKGLVNTVIGIGGIGERLVKANTMQTLRGQHFKGNI